MNLIRGAVAPRISAAIDYGGLRRIRHGNTFGGILERPPSQHHAKQDEPFADLSRAITDGSQSDDPLREMAATMAYRVNQPLAAIVLAGETALHWLDQEPADIESARRLILGMAADARRAAAIVKQAYLARADRAE
jgi:two-component system, LuxR family, sensor kinase FixL